MLQYSSLLAEKNAPRVEAYRRALAEAVRPGCTVLDLGCGVGTFSFIAAELGAGRVIGIDTSPHVEIAQQLSEKSSFSEILTFLNADSLQLELSERVDLLLADVRGATPFFGGGLAALIDARVRLLAADGVLIPKEDRFFAALVEAPGLYQRYLASESLLPVELQTGLLRNRTLNCFCRYEAATQDRIISDTVQIGSLCYKELDSTDAHYSFELSAKQPGSAHGFLLWFDAELSEGIGFSNHPSEPELTYGQLFFPFRSPLVLTEGDAAAISWRADQIADRYVYTWETCCGEQSFQQSTFFSEPIDPDFITNNAALQELV